jgi:transposase
MSCMRAVRTFRTFYGVMGEAARWLVSLGVTHVAMEATGIYSMPVYYALLEHGDFGKVLICNAAHVKNVPGRKTDYADAEWLARLPTERLTFGPGVLGIVELQHRTRYLGLYHDTPGIT